MKTPSIICFVIGAVLAIIGFSLIGKSNAAVCTLVILGVALVVVGLALYPWAKHRGRKDVAVSAAAADDGRGRKDVAVLAAAADDGMSEASARRRRRSSSSKRIRDRKTVSWPADSPVATYREFHQEQPSVAVAASRDIASEPRYETPYDDVALQKAVMERAAQDEAAAQQGGPVYYTPGQALPYYRTPDEIAEERQLALARPNTPELDRKRRMGELAEFAAGLKLERGVFSVPIASANANAGASANAGAA
jgi:xanthosine utilization system XapX-like protein